MRFKMIQYNTKNVKSRVCPSFNGLYVSKTLEVCYLRTTHFSVLSMLRDSDLGTHSIFGLRNPDSFSDNESLDLELQQMFGLQAPEICNHGNGEF